MKANVAKRHLRSASRGERAVLTGGWPSIGAHLFFYSAFLRCRSIFGVVGAVGIVFFDGKMGAARPPPFVPSLYRFGILDPSQTPLLGYLIVSSPFLAGPRRPTERNGAEERVLFYGAGWGCFPFSHTRRFGLFVEGGRRLE